MAEQKLVNSGVYFYCSSSIGNFREKIKKRFFCKDWIWWKHRNQPITFFGMYHIGDYLRFIWSRGHKMVVWCGGDIVNLKKPWSWLFNSYRVINICENEVERGLLEEKGITSLIQPFFFGNDKDYKVTFKPSKTPHVFLCAHAGREKEYGVDTVERISGLLPSVTFHIYGISGLSHNNIVYHGKVSEKQFDKEIRNYHCGLRLNKFDGFSEVTIKSILNSGYPITMIRYPKIDCATDENDLVRLLDDLSSKSKPNPARDYWLTKI